MWYYIVLLTFPSTNGHVVCCQLLVGMQDSITDLSVQVSEGEFWWGLRMLDAVDL